MKIYVLLVVLLSCIGAYSYAEQQKVISKVLQPEYLTLATIIANMLTKFHDTLPTPTKENPNPRWQRLKKLVYFAANFARLLGTSNPHTKQPEPNT